MLDEKYYEKLKKRDTKDIVNLAQKLVQIQSFSGSERKIVRYLMRYCSRAGFNKAYYDKTGNFIGEMVFGTGRGPKIVLTGHLDTVGVVEEEWDDRTQPFAGSIINGRLYGRAAADMKSADAAMISAIAEAKEAEADLDGTVYFVGSVVEELFEGVSFLEAITEIKPDYVIVGESSRLKINIGQRGRCEITITSFGQPQHASTGRNVINAIEQVAFIIDQFHRWYRSPNDPILGKRNVVPTDLKIPVGGGGGLDGRGGNSTVPNKVEVTYDIRTLVGDNENNIMKLVKYNLENVVHNGRSKYPNFETPKVELSIEAQKTFTNIEINQPKFAPAWETEKDTEIVKSAGKALDRLGEKVEFSAYKFCTDGSGVVRYREHFPDDKIEVIGYGPGDERDAHTVNESVSISDIDKAFKGYTSMILELLKKET